MEKNKLQGNIYQSTIKVLELDSSNEYVSSKISCTGFYPIYL